MIENPCERCENRDLCPVYRGEHCLLAGERMQTLSEEIARSMSVDVGV